MGLCSFGNPKPRRNMNRLQNMFLSFVLPVLLTGFCFAAEPVCALPEGQEGAPVARPLEPYILIGQTRRNLRRTSRDIIGRLFLRQFDILGKYHPAGDPDRYVLVVSNRDLQAAVEVGKPPAGYLAGIRLAITKRGELTYVSCQDPVYWGHVFLREDYVAGAENLAKFKRDLLSAMPKMRVRFNRAYGGHYAKPMTPERILDYHYQWRAERFEDMVTLGTYGSHDEALKAVKGAVEASEDDTLVFEVALPGKQVVLLGLGLRGSVGEGEILAYLETGDQPFTVSLPWEVLVVDKQVLMLPVRYRLPISSPGMDKKTFRKLKRFQKDFHSRMTRLLTASGS